MLCPKSYLLSGARLDDGRGGRGLLLVTRRHRRGRPTTSRGRVNSTLRVRAHLKNLAIRKEILGLRIYRAEKNCHQNQKVANCFDIRFVSSCGSRNRPSAIAEQGCYFKTLLYSVILCYTLLYSIVLCHILLYSVILCYTLLYSFILCYTLLYSVILLFE